MPRLLSCLLLVTAAAVARAAPPTVSLTEAIDQATASQPRVRRALAELAWRQREAAVPRAAWYPQLGAGAQLITGTSNNSTATVMNVPEVDLVRIGGTPMSRDPRWRPAASSLVAVTVDQQIYDFGRIAAHAAVADALTEAASADADTARLEVQLAAQEAFFAVRAAHEIQQATEEAFGRVTTYRDFVQAGVRSGLRSPNDLARAVADVAQIEVRRVRARTGLDSARAALAAAIGSREPQVDARVDAPDGAIDAALAQAPPVILDEAVRLASARHPLLRAALARTRAQQATSRALLHELLPNLFATATLSARGGGAAPSSGPAAYGDGWLPSVPNWHIGLVLQWNAVDAVVLARRAAAEARVQLFRADEEVLRTTLGLGVTQAALEVEAAREALRGLAEVQRAALANYAQARARFGSGLGTTLEMADAEALVSSAQLEVAMGRFAVARAAAQLGRALGLNR